MNCCHDYAGCTQGRNCPVRECCAQEDATAQFWGKPLPVTMHEPETDKPVSMVGFVCAAVWRICFAAMGAAAAFMFGVIAGFWRQP